MTSDSTQAIYPGFMHNQVTLSRPSPSSSEFTSSSTLFPVSTTLIVSRFPPELLSCIFMILSVIEPPKPGPPTQTLGWIRSATHVCRSDSGAIEVLARAKQTPLYVDAFVDVFEAPPYRTAKFVTNLIARTRVLHVSSEFITLRISALLNAPAPMLETLEVAMLKAPLTERITAANFLGGVAPVLNTLRVRGDGLWFPWASPVLGQLVSLEVTCSDFWHLEIRLLASVGQVLRALGHMSNLEDLVLFLAFRPEKIDGQERVALPRLRKLDLKGPLDCAIPFLQELILPAGATLQMRVMDKQFTEPFDMKPEDIGALFDALSSSHPLYGETVTSLDISYSTDPPRSMFEMEETLPTKIVIAALRQLDARDCPWTLLEFPRGSVMSMLGVLVTTATRLSSPADLRELRMLIEDCDEATWRSTLNMTTSVQEIHATRSLSSLCSALGAEGLAILAPRLQTLVLHGIVSTPEDTNNAASSGLEYPWSMVARCLAVRVKKGTNLERLDLMNCSITKNSARILAQVVPGMNVVVQT
ncbi:hypothetical protein FA95DRAFT_1610790 [Auriscalpium vulgare]|uniref:Uncharacterized protein n=1 Tax=Auriscalpium vulgare TaxID=40419 RepID=A0ACB8RCN9_9AGAM|nr:hypothetical protein FA95DRAFT_1610790 [Auriscalpium vulgare]